jgi:hypothetical protein
MLIPVILCGGAGSGLWLVSREMHFNDAGFVTFGIAPIGRRRKNRRRRSSRRASGWTGTPSPFRGLAFLRSASRSGRSPRCTRTPSRGALLREIALHCPDILEATRMLDDSIDFAVMEKSGAMAMVPCSTGWSDVGSCSAVGDLSAANADGHRVVVGGKAEVLHGEETPTLRQTGPLTYRRTQASLHNPGVLDGLTIEVQSGDDPGEGHIGCFDHKYARS